MRSHQLEDSHNQFVGDAAAHLQAELDAGAEVPFELESTPRVGTGGGRERAAPSCTATGRCRGLHRRALAGAGELGELRGGGAPAGMPAGPRPLPAQCDVRIGRGDGRSRATWWLRTLLEELFAEQTDFAL